MSSDDTLITSIRDIYSTLALFIGHAVMGAVTLAIVGGLGWLTFIRGRRWLYGLRAKVTARRAGWRLDEEGWEWTSPDGATKICEVALPGQWTIYRGRAYSEKEYPLHYALRWAMQPLEKTPWVKMVYPSGGP